MTETFFRIRPVSQNKFYFINTTTDSTILTVKSIVGQLENLAPTDFELKAGFVTSVAGSGASTVDVPVLPEGKKVSELPIEKCSLLFLCKRIGNDQLEPIPTSLLAGRTATAGL